MNRVECLNHLELERLLRRAHAEVALARQDLIEQTALYTQARHMLAEAEREISRLKAQPAVAD